MWFWWIVGLILLAIAGNAAREARMEQRDKRKEQQLKEINEKLGENEDVSEDTVDFLGD